MVSSWELDAMNRAARAQESRARAEWAKVQAIRAQTAEIRKLRESVAFLLENAVLRCVVPGEQSDE